MESTYDKFSRTLNDIGLKLVTEIRQELADKGVNASGRLSDSVEYRIDGNAVEIWAYDYMEQAQFGTPPTHSVTMNFVNQLAQWALDKGLVVNHKYALRFGYLTAAKIATYGSTKYRGSRPVDDVLEKPVQDVLDTKYADLQQVLVDYANELL